MLLWLGERTHGGILLHNCESIVLNRLHNNILRGLLFSFQALFVCLYAFRVALGVGRICHLHCEFYVDSIFQLGDDKTAAQGLH